MTVSLRKYLHRNSSVVLMWLHKLIWIYFHSAGWFLPSACSTGTMWEVALPCTMTSPTRWANWVTARTSPDTSITHIQENQCGTVTTWSYESLSSQQTNSKSKKKDEMVSECIHGALKSVLDFYWYVITLLFFELVHAEWRTVKGSNTSWCEISSTVFKIVQIFQSRDIFLQ